MRKLIGFGVLTAIVGLAPVAWAQKCGAWRGSGGWGMGGPYARMYDPTTVETLKGTIVSIDEVSGGRGMAPGIHANVKTDKETISVHLGPAWFLNNQDVKLQKGDTVEVKGSRIAFQGTPALIAAEVRKGGATLKLRESDGTPLWAGWRRPPGS
jgi:hypothetical protein